MRWKKEQEIIESIKHGDCIDKALSLLRSQKELKVEKRYFSFSEECGKYFEYQNYEFNNKSNDIYGGITFTNGKVTRYSIHYR